MCSPIRGCILDVGQCPYDHQQLCKLIDDHFDVDVDRAYHLHDALKAMTEKSYELVVVNRIIGGDGTEGLELIRRAKADPRLQDTPIMLISNYVDVQNEAVKLGAEEGFGKDNLFSESVRRRLGQLLKKNHNR